MVSTRKTNSSKECHQSRRIRKDLNRLPELRPRNSAPNYREESPDDYICRHRFLNVKVNRKGLHHKLTIRNNTARQNAISVIHKYKLRKSNQLQSQSYSPKSQCSDNNDNKVNENLISKIDCTNDTDMSKPTFKRHISSSFKKFDNIDNTSPKCYENNRRYPIRMRRQPTDMYMVNCNFKNNKKPIWNDSLTSPQIVETPLKNHLHYHKLNFHSKRSDETDDSEDELMKDELRFERRRRQSMFRARSELKPINVNTNELKFDFLQDRNPASSRSNFVDIDPMIIDKSITFQSVGGNKKCLQSLKESVILPLIYPEVFEKLSIRPPRGLLFYGPPGSGKTLIARALVNECSVISPQQSGPRVSFFMRKGADCLSKWVGESERQLRLLFDQAYRMRPSIIFFDEIDGLAPVRSSRQDQIHSSIVSTLLSLIDGLDDRGEIIVIGATNRLDAIDPALRRPGRFDREFLFTLPDKNVRREILGIHTKDWIPKLSLETIEHVASITNGFSGADLKALVVEAGLCSLRRRYPQIYHHSKKFELNLDEIKVTKMDIESALHIVHPSNQRSITLSPQFHQLPIRICNLLEKKLTNLREVLSNLFHHNIFSQELSLETDLFTVLIQSSASSSKICKAYFTPKLLITGFATEQLISGLLYNVPGVHIFQLDSVLLSSNHGLSNEEKICHVFQEAERVSNSLVFVPQIDILFHSLDLLGQNLLRRLLVSSNHGQNRMNDHLLVVVATLSSSDPSWMEIDCTKENEDEEEANDDDNDNNKLRSAQIWLDIKRLFQSNVFKIPPPTVAERYAYFGCLLDQALGTIASPPETPNSPNFVSNNHVNPSMDCTGGNNNNREYECLKEVEFKPRELTKEEKDKLELEEEIVLRRFRMILRTILTMLAKERKFIIFQNPVDEEEAPDYYSIITSPMDLSTMRSKVDLNAYLSIDQFRTDLHLISTNALLYNPPRTTYLKDIRRHAYDFIDCAVSVIEEHLSQEFELLVAQINDSRESRGYYKMTANLLLNNTKGVGTNNTVTQQQQQQMDNCTEYLMDLNNSKLPTQNVPLLRSQLETYEKFYKESNVAVKTLSNRRSQSDTEIMSQKRTTRKQSLTRSKSVSANHSFDDSNISSFDILSKSKQGRNGKVNDVSSPMEVDTDVAESNIRSISPITRSVGNTISSLGNNVLKIDKTELIASLHLAADKTDRHSLEKLEQLYLLMSKEIDRFSTTNNRTTLPKILTKLIEKFVRK